MLRQLGEISKELQRIVDVVITGASFIAAYLIKRELLPFGLSGLSTEPNYYLVLLFIMASWHIAFSLMGMHVSYRRAEFFQIFVKIIKSVFTGLVILNIVLFLFHMANVSRLLILVFLIVNISLLTLSKYLIYRTLSKIREDGFNIRYVLIVGSKDRAIETINEIERFKRSGYKILGCFDVDDANVGRTVVNGHKIIGTVTDLQDYLQNQTVDELIFAMPLKKIENAGRYLTVAESLGIKVRIIPDWQIHHLLYQPGIARIQFEDFLGIHTMTLESTPFNEGKLLIKTALDKLIAFLLFVPTLPLFTLIAIAIKLSSKGPVLYKQVRLGQNGRRFNLLKFRTMCEDADKLLCKLKCLNEADGPAFKIKNDPRIIPYVGTFLRKSSLDELPQLINILLGHMSLVGPRPPIPEEVDEYSLWQRRRLSIKPGLTCYWQIAPRRNELSFEEWMHLDLKYIDTWSLFTDFKILFLTAKAVLTGAGR